MQVVTAVQDRLDLDLEEVKSLLGIDEDDESRDGLIELFLAAAKEAADEYLGNPFLEVASGDDEVTFDGMHQSRVPYWDRTAGEVDRYSDPQVELDIPNPVKLGVFLIVQYDLGIMDRGGIMVQRDKVGDLQRDYAMWATKTDLLEHVKETFWRQYRLSPGT